MKAEADLVIVFGDSVQGDAVRKLVAFGDSLGIPVKYVCLVDYSNSRGAFDMGVLPRDGGLSREQMLAATDLDVLWVVGANPLKSATLGSKNAFVVVQDLFMTETAKHADIVLPAASAYEKNGTVTNVCGEVQRLKQAVKVMGTKTDLEIFGLIAKEMGLDLASGSPTKSSRKSARTCTATMFRRPFSRSARCRPCRSTDAWPPYPARSNPPATLCSLPDRSRSILKS